jgi:hypothetical protein
MTRYEEVDRKWYPIGFPPEPVDDLYEQERVEDRFDELEYDEVWGY